VVGHDDSVAGHNGAVVGHDGSVAGHNSAVVGHKITVACYKVIGACDSANRKLFGKIVDCYGAAVGRNSLQVVETQVFNWVLSLSLSLSNIFEETAKSFSLIVLKFFILFSGLLYVIARYIVNC
jgi:hypothetical protein